VDLKLVVIDTSAVLAILLGEPEAAKLARVIAEDGKRYIAPVSHLESSIVITTKKGPLGLRELDLFLYEARVEIAAMDEDQALFARIAYLKYGKGHHPAGLNLGDCCSYALAMSLGEPLLFKGRDFALTDVSVVTYR
jgi:ribonuclease VapC